MILGAAKITKFILFVMVLIFGTTTVPQILFLLFFQSGLSEPPSGALVDIFIHLAALMVTIFGFIGISSWIKKQEDVFY